MRVLHLNPGNIQGGIEAFLQVVAAQGGPHEFALCFRGPVEDALRSRGGRVELLGPVRARYPWTVWRARRRLSRLLRQPAVVVAHGAWTHALGGPVARRRGSPLVLFQHDVPGDHWMERWSRRTRPDLVLANSEFVARAVAATTTGVRCEVVHCPVPVPQQPQVGERARLRSELGVTDSEVVIVTTARLDPYKGHRVLIEALRRLPPELPWRAWIAGGAETPAALSVEKMLREACAAPPVLGRVSLLGHRRDVPALLAAADVACQPNVRPEPFGIALVEALAAGLPVVTSAMGGALEIVDASCGVLIPPRDPGALARALEELVRDGARRRALGATGPARARSLCDPARQLSRLEELLGVVDGGRT